MAQAKDHGSSWSAALEDKCARETGRLHARLTKILRDNLESLLESGEESDFSVLFDDDAVHLHSCLIQARLPELWQLLANDEKRHLVGKATSQDNFMQILRYIYTLDDITPAQLLVSELSVTIRRLRESTSSTQKKLDENHRKTISQPSDLSVERQSLCSDGISPEFVQSRTAEHVSSHMVSEESLPQMTSDYSEGSGPDYTSNQPHREIDELETLTAQLTQSGEVNRAQLTGSGESAVAQSTEPDEPDKTQLTGTVAIYCKLGQDLLHMYQTTLSSNVRVKVKDATSHLHRCILYARSSYFSAMLGGQWRESEAREIKLEGINSSAMRHAFVYLYGGIPDIDLVSTDLVELLTIADMYGLDGLKDIISFLMRKACHFYHKPCNDCVPWVINVLPMAAMFGLSDVEERAIRWCSRHVSRVWGAKQFANLPQDIQNNILRITTADITDDSVIEMVLECDRLGGSLTSVRRSEPVIAMAAQLMDSCVTHLKSNFVAITRTNKFQSLGKHMALGLDFLDDVFCRAMITMPTSKACATYVRVCELHAETNNETCTWSDDFKQLIGHLEEKCEHFMRLYINQLINTDDWTNLLNSDLQERIKEGAWYVCVGDGRRLRGPPRCVSYYDPSNPPGNDTRPSGRRPPPPPGGATRSRSKPAAKPKDGDVRCKTAPGPRKTSSLPRPKRKKSETESDTKVSSCTFKAMKMAGDVMTSPSDVQRIKPIVRKSSSEEPSEQDLSVGSQSSNHSAPASQSSNHSAPFPSQMYLSVDTCHSSCLMTSSACSQGNGLEDVFCSPEREYFLVPTTIIKSLEVEAINFPREELIPWLQWRFYLPKLLT